MPPLTAEQRALVTKLVSLRHAARWCIKGQDLRKSLIPQFEVKASTMRLLGRRDTAQAILECVANFKEMNVQSEFDMIEIGQQLILLSQTVADHVPREVWLEALGVNRSQWDTEEMREYGQTPINVVAALQLENSATKTDEMHIHPLHWCHTKAFMNELKTNRAFDRVVHDGANEFFNGIFGEYRERSPLERMGVPTHMVRNSATGHQ